jgi:parvulin-like peptidyl-prolyl isomerase
LAGNDFSELVAKHSISESKNNNGNIGSVDIRYYSENIRQELISLTDEDFTKPLEFGNQFIILKKVK